MCLCRAGNSRSVEEKATDFFQKKRIKNKNINRLSRLQQVSGVDFLYLNNILTK